MNSLRNNSINLRGIIKHDSTTKIVGGESTITKTADGGSKLVNNLA